jgi:hypothetical protein
MGSYHNYQILMKTKHVPFIPTMANENFLEGNKGNMEETRERMQGWENLQTRAKLSVIF